MRIHRDTSMVKPLIGMLEEAGVTLPAPVRQAGGQLMRLHEMAPFAAGPPALPSLVGLSDAGLMKVLNETALAYAVNGSGGAGESARGQVRRELEVQLADAICELGDEIIDHLRPDFDTAGKAVHAAVQLGITPDFTDRDVIKSDDIVAVRDAWTAMPALARKLDEIAGLRILLTQVAGVAPAPVVYATGGPSEMVTGAMFHDDAPRWRAMGEHPVRLWLRLCARKPVRLLSTAEAAAAAGAVETVEADELDEASA